MSVVWDVLEFLLEWWPWLVGAVGIGGALALIAALFLLGPVVVLEFMRGVAKALFAFFAWVISYRIGCAILAALIAAGAADLYRRHVDAGACDARIEQLKADAEEARKTRDAQIKADIEKQYQPRIAELQQQYDDYKKWADDYAKTHPDQKGVVACPLGTDALRLRQRK